jgi:hypothetical protein
MKLLIALGIGAAAGLVDTVPMVMRRVDPFSIASAFLHWVVVGVIVAYVQADIPPRLKGLLVSVALALPVIVGRLGQHPESAGGILLMSVVLGAIVGILVARFAR